jgi:hypothetical protein
MSQNEGKQYSPIISLVSNHFRSRGQDEQTVPRLGLSTDNTLEKPLRSVSAQQDTHLSWLHAFAKEAPSRTAKVSVYSKGTLAILPCASQVSVYSKNLET